VAWAGGASVFDHDAAATASWACTVSARRVDDVADGLTRAVRDAVVHWHGLGRGQFHDDVSAALTVLSRLRDDLVAMAQRIDAGADLARLEQARRDAERDWRRDLDEASRAARLAVPR